MRRGSSLKPMCWRMRSGITCRSCGDRRRGAAARRAESAGRKSGSRCGLELQADCFAGIWAHSTEQRNLLESGDVESALGAAAAVGDDRLQKMSRGEVNPDTFTHGSSAQRMDWFQRGFKDGQIPSCNTFQ